VRHWPEISRTQLAEIFAEHTGYLGNRRAGLGSETASTRQQDGDQAGPIGKPAPPDVRRSSRVALDTNSANASPLASAKALLVTSRAPGAVVLKNRSKRGHRRLSSRSVEVGIVGAACCRPGLRKLPGNAGKHFLPPKRQRHSSPLSPVEKAMTRAYNQAVDATKRTRRILSAIVTKPKGLINVGAKCPVPQRKRTASKLLDMKPRCKVAGIDPTAGAFQSRQISKPRAKRPAPVIAGRNPRKR
jgi:hypothetical protein